jgi:hypothetical protein
MKNTGEVMCQICLLIETPHSLTVTVSKDQRKRQKPRKWS